MQPVTIITPLVKPGGLVWLPELTSLVWKSTNLLSIMTFINKSLIENPNKQLHLPCRKKQIKKNRLKESHKIFL